MGAGSFFILLVDDDAAFAAAAAQSFESVGMRAVVALGSTASFDAFAGGTVDVLVTDIKRESYSLKLAQMIKSRKQRAPIILMTAHPELLEHGALAAAESVKPLEIAELCRAIRVCQVQ
jgi:DNA-binding NtrC family response regulator